MTEPILNLSRYSGIEFVDGSIQSTASAPSLSALPGQLNENQMPSSLGAGTSLQLVDVGTF